MLRLNGRARLSSRWKWMSATPAAGPPRSPTGDDVLTGSPPRPSNGASLPGRGPRLGGRLRVRPERVQTGVLRNVERVQLLRLRHELIVREAELVAACSQVAIAHLEHGHLVRLVAEVRDDLSVLDRVRGRQAEDSVLERCADLRLLGCGPLRHVHDEALAAFVEHRLVDLAGQCVADPDVLADDQLTSGRCPSTAHTISESAAVRSWSGGAAYCIRSPCSSWCSPSAPSG